MDEELYLHCLDCGEAFDSIRTAWDHDCEFQKMPEMIYYKIDKEL